MKRLIAPILLVFVCHISYGQAELYWVKKISARDSIKLRGVQISPFKTVNSLFPDSTGNVTTVSSIATNSGTGVLGGTITATGTIANDTTNVISTKANVLKVRDSLQTNTVHITGTETISGIKNFSVQPTSINPTAANHVTTKAYVDSSNGTKGSGTVTSVATNTGTGVIGGTFTTTGTISNDTTNIVSTKANAWKIRDSLQANINNVFTNKILSGSATLVFPSTAIQSSSEMTITVSGVAVGDVVNVSSTVNPANSAWTAYGSAANTVTVRFNNYSNAAITPASGTFNVRVIK